MDKCTAWFSVVLAFASEHLSEPICLLVMKLQLYPHAFPFINSCFLLTLFLK